MFKQITSLSFAILPLASGAAVIADFQSDTVGNSPTGWFDDNGFDVALDPTDSGNHVLATTGRGGNFFTGTTNNATLAFGDTGVLEFRVYQRSDTAGDVNVGLTDVADLSTLSGSDADLFGPLIRIVDGALSIYHGDGSGSGSFNLADQATSLNTWYTISMTVNNDTGNWTGSIVGGAFATPTELTYGSGASSTFGFRTDNSDDMQNFVIRANSGNTFANGALLDDISLTVIPEPQTYGMIALVGLGALMMRWRRRA